MFKISSKHCTDGAIGLTFKLTKLLEFWFIWWIMWMLSSVPDNSSCKILICQEITEQAKWNTLLCWSISKNTSWSINSSGVKDCNHQNWYFEGNYASHQLPTHINFQPCTNITHVLAKSTMILLYSPANQYNN